MSSAEKEGPDPRVLVIGDSHVRTFTAHPHFLPLFLGSGKQHCFVSDEKANRVRDKLHQVLDAVPADRVVLVFGEPDTRWQLGLGWTPFALNRRRGPGYWWAKLRLRGTERALREIDLATGRYQALLAGLRDRVPRLVVYAANLSIRPEQNRLVEHWNDRMRSFCAEAGLSFCDINPEIRADLAHYVSEREGIHLGFQAAPLIVAELRRLGLAIPDAPAVTDDPEAYARTKERFEFDERFGCYTYRGD